MTLSDLTFDQIVSDPLFAGQMLVESLVRNIGAEWWLWAQILVALALGLAVDLSERRDLRQRYASRNFRVDLTYALVDLFHIAHFTVLIPAGLLLSHALQTYAGWLTIDSLSALPAWAQLAILFIVTDFCVYWYHRGQHMNIVLWQFHKTHHSQRHMIALTGFRMPIFDRLVTLAVLSVPAAVMGVSYAYPLAILTVIYFHQLLIHSATGWSFGPLGWLIVSPQFHEIHHSTAPAHIDKNFGGALAIWDHLFGTYASAGEAPIRWGLVGERVPESFLGQIFVPIVGLYSLTRKRWRTGPEQRP
tara:strand:- start:1511 stop:2419 length:909 start_codon:yes stop_codon:yes gene_type:complete